MARSAVWRLAEVAGVEALSFGFMTFLARLLVPADFGIVAMASFFTTLSQPLLFHGLPLAMIQADDLGEARRDSVFWANMACGIALSSALLVLCWPVSLLMGKPMLGWVLAALAPLPLLFAAIGVYQAGLRREMGFRSLAIRAVCSVCAGGTVGVALAFGGWGVWSLVSQQLAYAAMNLAVLLMAGHWRPAWRLDWSDIRALSRVGGQISGTTLLDTLSQSGLLLLIGFSLPAAEVGLFFLARRLVLSLFLFTTCSISEISLPVLSRLHAKPEAHRDAVYTSLRITALTCLPAFGGVALTAKPLVEALFGNHWLGSVRALQLLVLAGIPQALQIVAMTIFTSAGAPKHALWVSALVSPILLFLVGVLSRYGLAAVASGVCAAYFFAALFTLALLQRVLHLCLARMAREQLPIWLAAAAMAWAVLLIKSFEQQDWTPAAQLMLESAAGVLAFGAVLGVLAPDLARWVMGLAYAGLPTASAARAAGPGAAE